MTAVAPATPPTPVAGLVFVVSGPSGVGKSSILRAALAREPSLRFSVSHTTRRPRDGETDGQDYHFVTVPEFRKLIDEGRFLEHAEYQGNLYGTSRDAVEGPTAKGIDLILEIEVQGAAQLRDRLPDAVTVFVLPPASEDLEARLRNRASDDETVIRKRLDIARRELLEARHYDHQLVNDELEQAVTRFLDIVHRARLERDRCDA